MSIVFSTFLIEKVNIPWITLTIWISSIGLVLMPITRSAHKSTIALKNNAHVKILKASLYFHLLIDVRFCDIYIFLSAIKLPIANFKCFDISSKLKSQRKIMPKCIRFYGRINCLTSARSYRSIVELTAKLHESNFIFVRVTFMKQWKFSSRHEQQRF